MVTLVRILLLPFSFIYACVMYVRNRLYDTGVFKSTAFKTKTIVVGNLRAGGAGKTPLVEYLVKLLQERYTVATLSRGYKRHTTGFVLANDNSTAQDIGDEPLQIKHKFLGITVSVCEKRVVGMQQLETLPSPPAVVLLDDAFQHRALKAGLYVLVTEYGRLYTNDYVIPAGRLRESRSGYRRAHIIVVSKCPDTLTDAERTLITRQIKPLPHQALVFSIYRYGALYSLSGNKPITLTKDTTVLMVTGIADNSRMQQYLAPLCDTMQVLSYTDHYTYAPGDIKNIIRAFNSMPGQTKMIITTEKDAVKLGVFQQEFAAQNIAVGILPMYADFFKEDKSIFDADVFNYMTNG